MINHLKRAAAMLYELVCCVADADEDLSDEDLQKVLASLTAIQDAIECELAQREEARGIAADQQQRRTTC
jgi:hypothetical protein